MEEESKRPWPQPLTFTGVAEFAYASWGRLLAFELITALAAAGALVFFFEQAWVPVINRTIAELPAAGEIRHGTLIWSAPRPVRAAGTSFLWIAIDPTDSLERSEGGDLQFEFGRTELRVRSLFGYLSIPYSQKYAIALNRPELEPWWGAWHPFISVALGLSVIAGLLVIWAAVGFVHAWVARFIAFYADHFVTWGGAWRLGTASLLPGALFLVFAIVAYSLQRINLVQLLAAQAGHVLIGWIYLLFAPFCLLREPPPAPPPAEPEPTPAPRDPAPTKTDNPFQPGGKSGASKPRKENPFTES